MSDKTHQVATSDETKTPPLFRVIKGNPTDTDLAALIAVLVTASGGGDSPNSGPRDLWGLPELNFRSVWGNSPLSYVNDRFIR
ncbi:MAG: acyl-CoA carboxylase subunit epsilon [Mycobacteriaceae bacterium]